MTKLIPLAETLAGFAFAAIIVSPFRWHWSEKLQLFGTILELLGLWTVAHNVLALRRKFSGTTITQEVLAFLRGLPATWRRSPISGSAGVTIGAAHVSATGTVHNPSVSQTDLSIEGRIAGIELRLTAIDKAIEKNARARGDRGDQNADNGDDGWET